MPSIQLPALCSHRIKELGWTPGSPPYSAYLSVLEAEEHVGGVVQSLQLNTELSGEQAPVLKEAEGKLVAVRTAGYFLFEFAAQSGYFGFKPSAELIQWFVSPPDIPQKSQRDVIIDSGTLLRDKFMRMFRSSNAPYHPPSSHPSRPSFDSLEDMIKDAVESSGSNYDSKRKKARALARDGYRCVVTGIYDKSSLKRCRELAREPGKTVAFTLEMGHIFKESIMQNIDPEINRDNEEVRTYKKTYLAASALTILKSFGFSKFVDAFSRSGGVHETWNLISFERNVHALFDQLEMWLEYTETEHRYKVCTPDDGQNEGIHRLIGHHDRKVYGDPIFVEFNSKHENAPPPDPFLLALHATCARVAHKSGAAEFFDQVEWDAEETRVLASDGSSATLLNHLLSPLSVIPAAA